MNDIDQQIKTVRQQIAAAEHTCQRTGQVTLLAVSKTKPILAIKQAYQVGQRAFGENYVQEGVDKIITCQQAQWLESPIEWHFIGPLQSNKSRLVAEHFDWVQTIDRAKIAQRLNEQRPVDKPPLNVCIQINISGEASKSGIALTEVESLAELIGTLPQLRLRGLMTIGTPGNAQQEFPLMQQIFEKLKVHYPAIDTLSMGMTADMAQAIQYGSTLVRIGSAIFGERDYHH
ncbi:YggS family pyridoxal phosphate-dependent enzyme [Celerinatantimonas yamalensis]|uniref:Pyridoxal phosphate homeostasis protein n=1 Tax=Celerinatantimonas yamalensis TaxID=559956 RepID=A0ABW9G8U7_9GAMM